jgi:hypothetical protein
MWLIKKMSIKCKWKILRHLVKKRKIGFRKMMVRMYHIQKLEKLGKYDMKELVKYPYKKIRKLFIIEFPNEYLHNPESDI